MKLFYINLNKFMWNHPFIKSCFHFTSGFTPYMVAIFYTLFLLKMYLDRPKSLLITAAEPIAVLTITLILKIIINRKRPCQKYGLIPIDGSHQIGHSFPSIHVAVSISIALAVLRFGPNMGLLLSVLAGIITVTRLFSGIHYISDILASILIAIIIDII